jgi:hippurate hydrolase
MVEEGLFERFPMEAVFGMHNWPGMPVGEFGVMPGPMMASSDEFEIQVKGRGGHAAMPHQTIDSVVIGSQIVQALQAIVSRNANPVDATVITVTQFHAGDAINVIPAEAVLRGTARAFRPAVQDLIEQGIRRICAGVAAAHGAQITVRYERHYPPTINSPAEAAFAAEVMRDIVGAENVHTDLSPTMGAEDFAFMLQVKPGAYVWIGNGPGEGGCIAAQPGLRLQRRHPSAGRDVLGAPRGDFSAARVGRDVTGIPIRMEARASRACLATCDGVFGQGMSKA